MFNFICKFIPHFKHSLTTSSTHKLHILQLNHLLSFSSKIEKGHSFSVNYFIDKCGFTPERALSASKYTNFNNPNKPDAVISFLKNQGFTETQVFKVISIKPNLALSNPEKTFLPKINYFLSQGLLKAELATMIATEPSILLTNLHRIIIPTFNLLTKLLGNANDTILTLKRCPCLIGHSHHYVVLNIEYLRKVGVPELRIRNFLKCLPRTLTHTPTSFKQVVEEVKAMGFDPMTSTFYLAISTIIGLNRSSWKKRMEVYEKWGCSEDMVLAAFMTDPHCMMVSNDKIDKIMNYFVNEFGWDSSRLINTSKILSLSLNKRIIPRSAVYKVLILKGFIKQNSSLYTLLVNSEEKFLEKYVECYKKEAPELLKLYQEKMKLSVSNTT